MKAYGHPKEDKRECKWGCCTNASSSKKNCRKVTDRVNRKSARQEAYKLILGNINE